MTNNIGDLVTQVKAVWYFIKTVRRLNIPVDKHGLKYIKEYTERIRCLK